MSRLDAGPVGQEETLSDGTRVVVRPIRADDGDLERSFIEGLSPAARRFRFLDTMTSPSPGLLTQLTTIDPKTDVAVVALLKASGTASTSEIGAARFSARADGSDCEFAIAVADAWQRKGLGLLLMRRLSEAARQRRIVSMYAVSASGNDAMRGLAARLGLRRTRDPDNGAQVVYRTAPVATEGAASLAKDTSSNG